jgi:hypothetical protein
MNESHSPDLSQRWRRVLRSRPWLLFIPVALYLIGFILQGELVGALAWLALYAFYGYLFIPPVWNAIKANPGLLHLFRLRWLRLAIGGVALILVACVGLAIASIFTASTDGIVQMVLSWLAGVGFVTILVAAFGGILSASKHSIEHYRAGH